MNQGGVGCGGNVEVRGRLKGGVPNTRPMEVWKAAQLLNLPPFGGGKLSPPWRGGGCWLRVHQRSGDNTQLEVGTVEDLRPKQGFSKNDFLQVVSVVTPRPQQHSHALTELMGLAQANLAAKKQED